MIWKKRYCHVHVANGSLYKCPGLSIYVASCHPPRHLVCWIPWNLTGPSSDFNAVIQFIMSSYNYYMANCFDGALYQLSIYQCSAWIPFTSDKMPMCHLYWAYTGCASDPGRPLVLRNQLQYQYNIYVILALNNIFIQWSWRIWKW